MNRISRRIWALALLAGFTCLAFCGSAAAQKAVDVTIPGKDNRSNSAKLYVPNAVPAPGVLVLHSFYGFVFGQAESFDHALGRALAKEGFVALVPNYAHKSLKELPHQPAVTDDLIEITRFLAARPEVGGKAIGVMGFSIGATHAVRLAAREPAIKAIVGYYGLYNLRKHAAFQGQTRVPPSPVEMAGRINAPVLLLHGAADDETRIDQAEEFKAALERAGKRVELATYSGAYHRFDRGRAGQMKSDKTSEGFTYRLDAKARDDAWKRALLFLRENLK